MTARLVLSNIFNKAWKQPQPRKDERCGIVIVSIPRSGTNHFCQAMTNFKEIISLFEIFHPCRVHGLDRYEDLKLIFGTEIGVKNPTMRQFANLFAANRAGCVRRLSHHTSEVPNRYFSFKVFPKQADISSLETIYSNYIKSAIFIVRRRLDSYVSQVKALEIQNWVQQDTTHLSVEVKVEEFLDWAAGVDDWFGSQHQLLLKNNIVPRLVHYDEQIDVPLRQLLRQIQNTLQTDNICLNRKLRFAKSRLKKQDRTPNVFDKMANGDEVKRQLMELGKLEYATTAPGQF